MVDFGSSLVHTNAVGVEVQNCPNVVPPGTYLNTASDTYTAIQGDSNICLSLVPDVMDPLEIQGALCTYTSGYDSNTGVTGQFLTDRFALPAAVPALPASLDLNFGMNNASSMCDTAPGMIGADRGNVSLPVQLHRQGLIDHAVGFCGGRAVGARSFLVLGSKMPSAPLRSTPLFTGLELSKLKGMDSRFTQIAATLASDRTTYYGIATAVAVGGKRISDPAASYSVMFDTGNPALVITQAHFKRFTDDVKLRADRVAGTHVVTIPAGAGGNANNFTCIIALLMSPADVAAIFPTLKFTFRGGVTASIPPDNYVISLTEDRDFVTMCGLVVAALPNTGAAAAGNGQMRLGAPFFRERFVQMDVQHSLIRMSALTRGCAFKGI